MQKSQIIEIWEINTGDQVTAGDWINSANSQEYHTIAEILVIIDQTYVVKHTIDALECKYCLYNV